MRRAAWVKQQLQSQRQTYIARQDGVDCRQGTPSAVAPHRHTGGVCAQRGSVLGQPGQRVPRVVAGCGKPVLRRQPWPTMTFEQIAKKVGKLRDPELGDEALDRILAWIDALRAAIPALRVALDEEAVAVFFDSLRLSG